MKYAVIQRGYSVFGVGESIEAAISEAAKWLCDETGVQGITPEQAEALITTDRVHGAIALIDSDDDEWDDYVIDSDDDERVQ